MPQQTLLFFGRNKPKEKALYYNEHDLRMHLLGHMFLELNSPLLRDAAFLKIHGNNLSDLAPVLQSALVNWYVDAKKLLTTLQQKKKDAKMKDEEKFYTEMLNLVQWIFSVIVFESWKEDSSEMDIDFSSYPETIGINIDFPSHPETIEVDIDFSSYPETMYLNRQEQDKISDIINQNVNLYKNKELKKEHREIMLSKLVENNLSDRDTIKTYEEIKMRTDKKHKCAIL